MYQNTQTATIPDHVFVAIEFAESALGRFNEVDQNEMLAAIQQRWKEHRSMRIEDLEHQLACIKNSLAGLHGEPAKIGSLMQRH